jgi:hypothetical protein
MIAKLLVIASIPVTLPLAAAGYVQHVWDADQQRWAEAREAAEMRYAQMVDLNCQFGQMTDAGKCSKALNSLAGRSAYVSQGMDALPEPDL